MEREVHGDLHLATKRLDGAPLVVFVHGVMDRGATFLGVTRRLPGTSWIVYDRRGYGRSLANTPPTFSDHVDDLVGIIDRETTSRPVSLVGHSLGGTIALAAASRRPNTVGSILVHEPPLPWLDWWPIRDEAGRRIEDDDVDTAVVRIMERLIGIDGWEALAPAVKARHLAEGPTLVSELVTVRNGCPFDPTSLTMPIVASRGSLSTGHRERAQDWLLHTIPTGSNFVVVGAGHNVQRSHPETLSQRIEEQLIGVHRRSIS